MLAVLGLSISLQIAAALVALGIARRDGWSLGWLVLSAGMILMVWRRVHALLDWLAGRPIDEMSELILLAISALVAMGVGLLARSFTTKIILAEELAEAKREVERSSQAKTEFLANISHELRTPLNAVIGFSQVMRNEMLGPLGSARYREYAAGIEESGQHLLQLIDDIMDVSQIESGRVDLREEQVHPSELVESVARLIRPKADSNRVLLFVEPIADLPELRVDARRIKQVLLNVLSNAVKYTPAGGRVELRCRVAESGDFVFEVSDTGIGIRPGDIDRVLRPLDRGESSYTRSYDGPGLGLPIARGLVELHGGSLKLDSFPNNGTQVVVRLPAARVVKADAAAAQA
ncbi:sensor histidine kinase [Magnetospirillum moscoviense]|uniref:sensor histidine kinase n=1 Tax=Magnetospirillum moscoviense TaxID=1437059 RepID=UPI0009ED38CF|nr:HAMP domain-containing sensor histidine kinase [Magnetospirillum moscoviense]